MNIIYEPELDGKTDLYGLVDEHKYVFDNDGDTFYIGYVAKLIYEDRERKYDMRELIGILREKSMYKLGDRFDCRNHECIKITIIPLVVCGTTTPSFKIIYEFYRWI